MKTMILGKKEIKELISIPDVIDAVEKVYKLKAEEETAVWPHVIYNFEEPKGVMDIKSGYVGGDMKLHGA